MRWTFICALAVFAATAASAQGVTHPDTSLRPGGGKPHGKVEQPAHKADTAKKAEKKSEAKKEDAKKEDAKKAAAKKGAAKKAAAKKDSTNK